MNVRPDTTRTVCASVLSFCHGSYFQICFHHASDAAGLAGSGSLSGEGPILRRISSVDQPVPQST